MGSPAPDTPLPAWQIERSVGPAGPFHARPLPSPLRPTAWVHRVERSALVLGSTQSPDLIDLPAAEAAGIEVCGRRSGGGIVLVEPDHSCWIDLLVPAGHHLWNDDVGRAFAWVGELLAGVLRARTGCAVEMHEGPMVDRAHGRVICFAGRGPGELFIDGRKVVGISQRRTREGARFQVLVVSRWHPERLEPLLRPGTLPDDLDLHRLPVGWPDLDLNLDGVAADLLAGLPTETV